MANIKKIKLPNGTEYDIKDSGALPLTGGTVTGPVIFQDTTSMDEATIGDLVVNGNASFTNNIQANTINGIAVGNSPKFTDTITTATTSGSGNAVTAITASNGALTVTKGATFLTSHQDISGKADKATTLSGYGITDAKISNGTITLGSNTITPLTSYVQSDWNEADSTADDYIKNKPTIPSKTSDLNNDVPFATTDTVTTSANGLMSSTDKSKLDGIESGAEVNYVTKITQHFIADPSDPQYVYPRSATLDYNAVGINDVELLTKTALGKFNGACDLDASSKVPKSRLPSTSTPTADEVSEFDSDAHMNSTDMTTGSGSELETFINGLIAGGGGVDSGTNYIKIGGIGICWGYTNLPAMSSPNGYAYATPTFPITFKSAPVVMPFLSAGFGAGRVIGVQAIHNAQTTTQGSIFVTNNAGGETGASTNGIGWVAFGQV